MSPSHGQSSPDVAAGVSSDHFDGGPPRKKMRKGTKSCISCRLRKAKCVFEPGRPAVCNGCFSRGTTCIDQEHADLQTSTTNSASDQASYSLRERVTQLEGLVKQVLNRIPDAESSVEGSPRERGSTDTPAAAEVMKSLKNTSTNINLYVEESLQLPDGSREGAPALSLFDNAVISRKDNPVLMSRSQYNKSKQVVAQLHALIPSPQDLNIILDESAAWWEIWRKMFPEISDRRCETIKDSVSHSLRSENPAEVAKILLCIAMSIYQLPNDWDMRRLDIEGSRVEIMEKYVNTIDRLITSDDELAATLDGIETMILQAKYHVNLGRPRKAWLLFRRAISFSQLLGLHRLSNRKPKNSEGQWERQISIWSHLFQGDRFLSLTLGLPYSVSEQFCTPYIPQVGVPHNLTDGEAYLLRLSPIISKIIDRNQSGMNVPFSATLRIDQELDELAQTQPQDWWKVSNSTDIGLSVGEHFDRRVAQFAHHQIRALLHMPFMLKSSSDKRFQYSHTAALESARETIRCWESLRQETFIGPFICKLFDFQAFTAAVLLLLNLLGYSQQVRSHSGPQSDEEQNQEDSTLVDRTIEILREASKEPGGHVAAQSTKALEMIAMARDGCDEPKTDASCQISIPYFGTITIGLGKHFVAPKRGTYPKPGEVRKKSIAGVNMMAPGLPTPPSAHSNSTQASPISASWDTVSSVPTTQYSGDQLFTPGNGPAVYTDDGFVSFDSFMALPQQDQEYPIPPPGIPTPFFGGPDLTPGGIPFPNWGLDLDQGWNWLVPPPETMQ